MKHFLSRLATLPLFLTVVAAVVLAGVIAVNAIDMPSDTAIGATGGTITGPLTVSGAGSTDCVVFDDNGVEGCTRTADEVPNTVVTTAQSAWPGATVNTTGANLVLGAGQGRTAITAFTFANCALDTVTLTVDGTSTVRTEGTHWTAATSDAATCASLLTALEALSGVSADSSCSGEELRLVKSLTTASISLAVSDATCATVTNGTDGIVRIYSGPGTSPGIATVLELGEQGASTGTNLITNGPNGNELYITTGTTRGLTSVNLARLLIRPSTSTYGVMGNLGMDINGNSGGSLRGGSSFVLSWNSAADLGSGASDIGLARNAAGVLRVTDGSTGTGTLIAGTTSTKDARTTYGGAATDLTCAGGGSATLTATNLIPDGAFLIGVSTRITTALTGSTGFSVGDGSDADLYGVQAAATQGSTTSNADATAQWGNPQLAAVSPVLTFAGGNCTAGVIHVVAHYLSIAAATSN